MRRPISIPEFVKAMNDLLHIRNGQKYLDTTLMMVTNRIELDLFKLDDHLHEVHGEYEDGKTSMSILLTREYGKEANEFVDLMIRNGG